MTNTDSLKLQLAEIARRNAANKIRIQGKRARFARTKASTLNLPKPDRFPTTYKYG